jgi:Peptidase family M28
VGKGVRFIFRERSERTEDKSDPFPHWGMIALACVAAAAYFAIARLDPPKSSATDSPAQEFSAGRAAVDVAAIAQRPHPVGSADHDRVRDYILKRLRALGVEPELQQTTAVFARDGLAGRVTNILARVKGTANTRAVMLATHYDSVPSGPGAGDDSSGVAVLLETLRALRAGPPLANDVIFLVTDGEEVGLLGAAAFTAEHPWAKDSGLVLNFDARGNSGPAMMFETTPGNGRLVKLLRQSAPYPRASSLTYAVYQRMPNDTDLTVFRRAGLAGLNFAFIGNLEAYHTRLDTPANLNGGTLEHQGSYAVAIARAAANTDLRQPALADVVYFNTIGSQLVIYPQSWTVPLAVAALLLLAVVILLALRRNRLAAGTMALAALVPPLSVGAAVAFGLLMISGARSLHHWLLPAASVAMSDWYAGSLVVLAVAVALALIWIVHRKIPAVALAIGALLWWALLSLVVSVLLPGASYLVLWPTIFATLAVGIGALSKPEMPTGAAGQVSSLALLLLAVLLLAPVGQSLHWAFPLHSLGTMILAAYTSFALCLIAEPLHRTVAACGWRAPAFAFAAVFTLFAAGASFTRYSPAHPQASNLFYLVDADTRRAYWASRDAIPNAWTERVLTRTPERGPLPAFFSSEAGQFLHHDAPVTQRPAPLVAVEGDSVVDGRRRLHLRVRAGVDTWELRVRLIGADVASATVNGKPIATPTDESREAGEEWSLRFFNPGSDGIELALEVSPGTAFTLRATAYLLGLPSLPGESAPPRPANVMPNHEGDLTLITHATQFHAVAHPR